jgi:hypothetical protein
VNIFVLVVSVLFFAAGVAMTLSDRHRLQGWMVVSFFGGCAVVAAWDLLHEKLSQRNRRARVVKPPAHGDRLVVKKSVLYHLAYFLGGAGFTAAGILMVLSGEQVVLGWVTAGFAGLGLVVFLWQLLDPRPRLAIDEYGIFDRMLGVGWIAWSDIERVYLHSINGIEFICLHVREPSAYIGKLSWIRRMLADANRALGFTELNVSLTGTTASTVEVLHLIHRYIQEQRDDHGRFQEDS